MGAKKEGVAVRLAIRLKMGFALWRWGPVILDNFDVRDSKPLRARLRLSSTPNPDRAPIVRNPASGARQKRGRKFFLPDQVVKRKSL